jgi:hypothetical protein
MNSFRKNVELAANIAIFIVSVLLCVALVKNRLASAPVVNIGNDRQEINRKSLVGEKINLPQVDWRKNGHTLLLALSTNCHFCSESTPFYQHLVKERSGNTRIVAVLPQPVSESQEYLNKHGVSVDDVEQVDLDSIEIGGTPTLIWVDDEGVVRDLWIGKLPKAIEAEVLERVQQNIARR